MLNINYQKIKYKFLLFLITLAICNINIKSYAENKLNNQSLVKFLNLINNVKTFEANFVSKEYFIDTNGEDRILNSTQYGDFILTKNGNLFWNYFTNSDKDELKQQLIADGKYFYILDNEIEELTISPLKEVLTQMPLNWLFYNLNYDDFNQNYQIKEIGNVVNKIIFELTPYNSEYVKKLHITIIKDKITTIEIYKALHGMIELTFSEVLLNKFNLAKRGNIFKKYRSYTQDDNK